MKAAVSLHTFSKGKKLAFTAAFAALCLISTLFLTIPLPASGYFNIGDVFVLLSGWCLGPLYGSIAAAVGSSLADILAGYGVYAPATFLIKGCDALIAYYAWLFLKKFIKKERLDFLVRTISAILGEAIMVFGYFLFDGLISGNFAAAVPNLLGNATQGLCCLVCAVLIVAVLYPVKRTKNFFPFLGNK